MKPLQFIRSIRLKRAAQLLVGSQYNVVEIADKVGFNTIKYFNRYFKEEFGMTPTQYREANKKVNKSPKTWKCLVLLSYERLCEWGGFSVWAKRNFNLSRMENQSQPNDFSFGWDWFKGYMTSFFILIYMDMSVLHVVLQIA